MSNGGRSATTSGARHASEGELHHTNAPRTPLLCRMVNCGQLAFYEVRPKTLCQHDVSSSDEWEPMPRSQSTRVRLSTPNNTRLTHVA
jgi:hypothetical protein